jgi:hypothetical protein
VKHLCSRAHKHFSEGHHGNFFIQQPEEVSEPQKWTRVSYLCVDHVSSSSSSGLSVALNVDWWIIYTCVRKFHDDTPQPSVHVANEALAERMMAFFEVGNNKMHSLILWSCSSFLTYFVVRYVDLSFVLSWVFFVDCSWDHDWSSEHNKYDFVVSY